ncbi:gamma-glutamyl-gamma-aminobutyrate hydrolase family protein [Streptomyces sp. NPDC021356]|uniref:gamma-glutamyl-gamma-aminobutyrate hydrolase family protein n=1 Tax=Streptomyces sp. NPDC021356 TaxID=3154900 RepID=UPI003408BD9E
MIPRIGITSRFRRKIMSHSLHQGYADHVACAGGLPLMIPCIDPELSDAYLSTCDGLLLTGGEDIDPLYCTGTARQPDYTYHPRRDAFEMRLTRRALDRGIPVLGICRGTQVLYAATGNSLIPHIPDVNGGLVAHRASVTEPVPHSVTLAGESRVLAAYGQSTVKVTSYHHQGLGEQTPGDVRWRVTATADDLLPEAVEAEGDRWTVGVLWHPELPAEESRPGTDPLIASFVAASAAAAAAG